MTALDQYARLEAGGLWRPEPDGQRREVTVSLGEATLILTDRAERPLTHWSLPAVTRLNPGERPAVFTPDPDAVETLEIADDLMIESIETVRKTVRRRKAHPGRLRGVSLGLTVMAVVGLGVFWLPGALIHQAQSVVPAVKRTEIGATLLGHIQRVTGPTCRSPLGTAALDKLHRRVLGPDAGGRVFVVPSGPDAALYLPGAFIVMTRDLVEDTEDPAVVAGHIIAAAAQGHTTDPLTALLESTGIGTTLTLLTTGNIPPDTLRSYAEKLFATPVERPADDLLIDMFADANVPSTPYAYAVDITGETTLSLIEADPLSDAESPVLLTDGEWISLQGLCE